MIVPMQKVMVLCLDAARNGALESLRELGVLHLTWERRADHADIDAARRDLDTVRRAREILPNLPQAPPSGHPPRQVVEELSGLIRARREMGDELGRLRQDLSRIEPFGSFAPQAITALAERGLFIRLFQAPPKQLPDVPEGAIYLETLRTKAAVFFALVTWGERPEIAAQEIRPPAMSLAELQGRIAELETAQAGLSARATRFGGDYAAVAELEAQAQDALQLAEAHATMGAATASIAYLQGFCPTGDVDRVRAAAAQSGWGLVIEEPEDTDRVPTLLRNPAWLKPIEAVFELIGILPGYREIDVSLWFLLFFSLFFAMLVGDAGYGAVFLGLTLWARRKFPQVPAHVFTLLKITSITTMIWGVLTGTYFGIPNLPAPLGALKVDWLGNEDHIKELCFWIAAIHLSIAHVWNIFRMIRTPQALAQVGWLCVVWFMFFGARSVVLDLPFPPIMTWVFGGGVLLIVLFMTPRKAFKDEWFNHVMLPLNLVSSFVDVISYIRLYAVGTASFAIASTFDIMLAPLFDGWLSGLFGVLLLFLAHTVNIILSAMGVMVHGIRLNTLEFAGHAGLQWSGIPYRPLRRKPRMAA
jgi:V/A-type H+/Na+-transporting ATPase subunit I